MDGHLNECLKLSFENVSEKHPAYPQPLSSTPALFENDQE